uniref:Ovule protein n=1 Tax=Meloidogyne incognita TaxID=6306 RepID=A0A914MCM8_MELIC
MINAVNFSHAISLLQSKFKFYRASSTNKSSLFIRVRTPFVTNFFIISAVCPYCHTWSYFHCTTMAKMKDLNNWKIQIIWRNYEEFE